MGRRGGGARSVPTPFVLLLLLLHVVAIYPLLTMHRRMLGDIHSGADAATAAASAAAALIWVRY